jgi:hypothetical protein
MCSLANQGSQNCNTCNKTLLLNTVCLPEVKLVQDRHKPLLYSCSTHGPVKL